MFTVTYKPKHPYFQCITLLLFVSKYICNLANVPKQTIIISNYSLHLYLPNNYKYVNHNILYKLFLQHLFLVIRKIFRWATCLAQLKK